MNSLFNVKFNWAFFTGIAILILWFFPGLSGYSYFALLITIHQFLLLFYSINYVIPIRYLFGALMCLQMLLGPLLAYNGLDHFQDSFQTMQISESEYFSYVIPAVIFFIAGLNVNSKELKGEILDIGSIRKYLLDKKELPFILIVIGFAADLLPTNAFSDFAFVIYLIGSLKYIGVFLLIICNSSRQFIIAGLVFGFLILTSIRSSLFHDMLIWLIFLGFFFALVYRPKLYVKTMIVIGFIIMALSIQLIKSDYREATWERGEETGLKTISKTYVKSRDENKFFNLQGLAESNIRINQGYIITHIMKQVPLKIPHAKGAEIMQILQSAFLPRFLSPDKLRAGDRYIFVKYTRIPVKQGTSMALSSVGDAYINFGVTGGCIFMLLLGIIYNEVLKRLYKYSKDYPLVMLFTPLIFLYAIRPDCELQTSLGHLVKSCFFIYLLFQLWKKSFKINYFRNWQRSTY